MPFKSYIKICITILFSILLLSFCKKTDQKNYKFGLPIKMMEVDTTGDGVMDTWGYYIPDAKNIRGVYEEIDKNGDGYSDEMIWAGTELYKPSESAKIKNFSKVHEEADENYDGKIDIKRWLLPNDFVALAQKDSDKDGYFETTIYYSYSKNPARREVDSNKDRKPDIIYFKNRVEVDRNFDGIPETFIESDSSLKLEELIKSDKNYKPLPKNKSWHLNPSLVPEAERAIILGSFNY